MYKRNSSGLYSKQCMGQFFNLNIKQLFEWIIIHVVQSSTIYAYRYVWTKYLIARQLILRRWRNHQSGLCHINTKLTSIKCYKLQESLVACKYAKFIPIKVWLGNVSRLSTFGILHIYNIIKNFKDNLKD